jgi:hypothetical protein
MEVAVESHRVVERVHAEAVLGEAGKVRPEQAAARSEDQPVVRQGAALVARSDDVDRAGLGVDRLDAALHIHHVGRPEQFEERRGQRLGRGFVEARPDHQHRLRRDHRDLELVGRDTLRVAEACSRERRVHAGEAGSDDDESLLHGSPLRRSAELANAVPSGSSECVEDMRSVRRESASSSG